MFDSIGNLPLHPLVLHAAVIGLPLALLLSVFFAVPRTRSWSRWSMPVVAVGAAGATFVAKESGEALQRSLQAAGQLGAGDPAGALIAQHAQLAGQLTLIASGFAVLGVLNAVLVGRVGGTPERPGRPVRDRVLVGLLLAAALISAFWCYRVGDLGARAVWNPTGTLRYASASR